MKILIYDDNPYAIEVFTFFIDALEQDHIVHAVTNYEELNVVKNNVYDVVFLDYDLGENITAEYVYEDIKSVITILITGSSWDSKATEFAKRNGLNVFFKPFQKHNVADLFKSIKDNLEYCRNEKTRDSIIQEFCNRYPENNKEIGVPIINPMPSSNGMKLNKEHNGEEEKPC